jgi:hypothetical protein
VTCTNGEVGRLSMEACSALQTGWVDVWITTLSVCGRFKEDGRGNGTEGRIFKGGWVVDVSRACLLSRGPLGRARFFAGPSGSVCLLLLASGMLDVECFCLVKLLH